jgi:hypothetical protein
MNPATVAAIRGGKRNHAVTIVAPLADAAAIKTATGLNLNINLANGSPSESPTHKACGLLMTAGQAARLWTHIDGALANSVVLIDESTSLPSYPWIFPGQAITLTDASNAYISCRKWSAFRDLTISSNSGTTPRRFCNIAGTFQSIIFDRCDFSGTAKATTEGATTTGRVTEMKIRECDFEATTHRVFECDPLKVDALYIQDNTLHNINSTVFFFPDMPATTASFAIVERNETICDPSHVAVPNGQYCSIGLIRSQSVECRDNYSEGYKTATPNKSTGTWDLRCSHILEERNTFLNCGAAVAEELISDDFKVRRRILNCKDGALTPTSGNFTGRWVDCTWTIQPAYFAAQGLTTPRIMIGSMNYRDVEVDGCTINVDTLISISTNERFLPSFKLKNTTITANRVASSSPTWDAIFWFDQDLARGAVTGDFIFEDSTITLAEAIVADSPTVLVRHAATTANTKFTFKNFTLNIPAIDYLFYVWPTSTNNVWTFDNAEFNVTSATEETWAQGRQPDTIINVGGS